MRRRALLLLPGLAACAELRRPVLDAAPPPGLLPPSEDPGRAAVLALAEGFLDAGAGWRGGPAELLRLAALLEWLEADLAAPRWAPVSRLSRERMALARAELRGVLGAPPAAARPELRASLAAAHRALSAGNRGAAASALAGLPGGGEAALARVSAPAPLPAAEIATGGLAEEVRALDAAGAWLPAATPVPPDLGGRGPASVR